MNINERESCWEKALNAMGFVHALRAEGLVNALKASGADFQYKNNSMTFSKNGFVMVVDYNPLNDDYLGTIMTYYVYTQLCDFYENMDFNLSLAQFAWAYGWGHDFSKDHMNAENAFEYLSSVVSAPYKNMNKMGHFNCDVIFMVREFVDEKPKGEFGVADSYYLIGAFNNFNHAMDVACKASYENRAIDIVPVIMNITYVGNDMPYLGGGWYID
jgi:hypothetical protein